MFMIIMGLRLGLIVGLVVWQILLYSAHSFHLSFTLSLSLYLQSFGEVCDYATNSDCFDFEGLESFEEYPNGHALAPMNCKKVSD